jgi:hypothetical protein
MNFYQESTMSKPKIGVVIGSTRPNRFGDKPAEWIANIAKARGDLDIEVIDLRDFPMPLFDEERSPPGRLRRTKSRWSGRRRSPAWTASSSPPPNTIAARPRP